MSLNDERFAARLREACPAPPPSADFDGRLARRRRGRPALLAWAGGTALAAAAAGFLLAPTALGPLMVPQPEVVASVTSAGSVESVASAAHSDELYAVLDLEAEDGNDLLPEDYAELADSLDL